MNTPADKPDLPAPDYQRVQTDGWEYGTVMHTDYYTADTVRRLLADERRKAEPEIIAAFLERSGQWLTNEATHKAFETETRRKALEEATQECSAVAESLAGKPARLGAVECWMRVGILIDRKEPTT